MSGLDDLVVKWWAGLNGGQRSRVKQSAERAEGKYNVGGVWRAGCRYALGLPTLQGASFADRKVRGVNTQPA